MSDECSGFGVTWLGGKQGQINKEKQNPLLQWHTYNGIQILKHTQQHNPVPPGFCNSAITEFIKQTPQNSEEFAIYSKLPQILALPREHFDINLTSYISQVLIKML